MEMYTLPELEKPRAKERPHSCGPGYGHATVSRLQAPSSHLSLLSNPVLTFNVLHVYLDLSAISYYHQDDLFPHLLFIPSTVASLSPFPFKAFSLAV